MQTLLETTLKFWLIIISRFFILPTKINNSGINFNKITEDKNESEKTKESTVYFDNIEEVSCLDNGNNNEMSSVRIGAETELNIGQTEHKVQFQETTPRKRRRQTGLTFTRRKYHTRPSTKIKPTDRLEESERVVQLAVGGARAGRRSRARSMAEAERLGRINRQPRVTRDADGELEDTTNCWLRWPLWETGWKIIQSLASRPTSQTSCQCRRCRRLYGDRFDYRHAEHQSSEDTSTDSLRIARNRFKKQHQRNIQRKRRHLQLLGIIITLSTVLITLTSSLTSSHGTIISSTISQHSQQNQIGKDQCSYVRKVRSSTPAHKESKIKLK